MANRERCIPLFVFFFFVGTALNATPREIVKVSLSPAEKALYRLLMEYRAENGLPSIPLSPSLTYVAQTHVRDLTAHPPTGNCNLHSWSEYGEWSPCCYTSDHAEAKNMWNKPRELSLYVGVGYEIAHWSSAGATAQTAMNGWKNSSGNAVMVNLDKWSKHTWHAVGIGIYGEYAVIWFGEEQDGKVGWTETRSKQESVLTPPISLSAPIESTPETIKGRETSVETPADAKRVTPPVQLSVEEQSSISQPTTARTVSGISTKTTSVKNETGTRQSASKSESKSKQRKLPAEKNTPATYSASQTTTHSVSKQEPYKPTTSRWPMAYYAYSGKNFMSVISLAYSYSFINTVHSVEASLFDFRTGLFGMTILGAEMYVYPYHLSVAYRPTVSLYLPAAKCFAFVPYISANVDATYLGRYFKRDFEYDKGTDFYAGIIAGIGLEVSAVRAMPMRVQVEYRHPLVKAQWQTDMRPSVNVGVKFCVGKAFGTK